MLEYLPQCDQIERSLMLSCWTVRIELVHTEFVERTAAGERWLISEALDTGRQATKEGSIPAPNIQNLRRHMFGQGKGLPLLLEQADGQPVGKALAGGFSVVAVEIKVFTARLGGRVCRIDDAATGTAQNGKTRRTRKVCIASPEKLPGTVFCSAAGTVGSGQTIPRPFKRDLRMLT